MAYILLVVGLILTVITFKRTWNISSGLGQEGETVPDFHYTGSSTASTDRVSSPAVREEYSAQEMEEIKTKLDVIADTLAELTETVEQVNKKIYREENSSQTSAEKFEEVLEKKKNTALYDEVCAAYEQGKDITELAREFGRGKGEIELILGLRR